VSIRSNERHLDPAWLRDDPTGGLPHEAYHTTVGPALKVCADVAAKRGDPTLHGDMPSMLALIDLVNRLADHYRNDHPDEDDRHGEVLDGAAAAACVMVFQEAKLPADAIGQCLAALETAYAQLVEHEVTAEAEPLAAIAWQQFRDDDREAAVASLERAAQRVVAAIDAWQARVH